VMNVYMEEFPLVSDWRLLTSTQNVVVVPFFISDGLHSYQDIPRLLGIDFQELPASHRSDRSGIFRREPYRIDDRILFYAASIGTNPGVADIILEQVNAFDEEKLHIGAAS
jgi:sirohydrochlorin cobaltochelatase